MAAPNDNTHAAIPRRFATTGSRNAKKYARRNNHSLQNTKEEPRRPQPQLPHTRGTFHRLLQPLYTEKHNVSCSQNIAAATFMQPHHVANLRVSTHMATPDDNNHAAIPMRSAHTETTARCRTQRRNEFADEITPAAPAAHRRYLSSPAATTLHGKTHGSRRAPASSTTQSPMQRSCSHHNASCSMTRLTRMYLRTWQHQMTTIIQPLHECIVM